MLLAYILIPLIGAAVMPIVRKVWPKASNAIALLVATYLVAVTVRSAYLEMVMQKGLSIDRWAFGGKLLLSIDGLSLIVLLAISLVALATLGFSIAYPLDPDRRPGFNALILLAVAGMNGLVLAADVFSLYVFLEIVSISSFILIAYQYSHEGIESSFKYMMLSAVATVLLLTGIAIVFAATGKLTFNEIAANLKTGGSGVALGLALIVFALAVKAGMMPFHAWLPDAYTGASAPVSIFLAGIVTKAAGVYTLMRLVLDVFGFSKPLSGLLLVIGALSTLMGAFMALGQKDFKRMLAFSSISQIGYIVMGFATGTPLGVMGAVFHLFNHSIFKSLLFLNAGAVEMAAGTRKFDELGGLTGSMPVTGVTSVIGFLSTAGLPPLAGFWSKLIIIVALWVAGYQWFAGIAVLTSLVTLAYLLSLQRNVFFGRVKEGMEHIKEVKPVFYWPAVLMAVITIVTGLVFPLVYEKLILPVNSLFSLIKL